MEHVDTQITSHLLAALNLPPIRHPPPSCQNCNPKQDRPRPVEPSTSKDAYTPLRLDRGNLGTSSNSPQGSTSHGVKLESPSPSEELDRRDFERDEKTLFSESVSQPAASEKVKKKPATKRNVSPSQIDLPATDLPPSFQKSKAATTTPALHISSTKNNNGRRARRKWTEEETNDLIKGCHIHGAGNWKKILDDPQFTFIDRSSVDLKDRFRTCFPTEYRKSGTPGEDLASGSDRSAGQDTDPLSNRSRSLKYPPKPTKTELEHAELIEKLGLNRHFPKAQRRERREFTAEEDCSLLAGFDLYGASWSKIQGDPALGLGHRRSTDLRDRFRNAYPEKYESAGFKARPRQRVNRIQRSSEKPPNLHSEVVANAGGPSPPAIEAVKDLEHAPQQDSASLLIQGILEDNISPSWETPEPEPVSEDQSPAPGSLALDPALNEGFEGSSLEQITEEFLAVAQGTAKSRQRSTGQGPQDMVRWEDMATHPIFELEPSLTGAELIEDKRGAVELRPKRRPVDEDVQDLGDMKRIRT